MVFLSRLTPKPFKFAKHFWRQQSAIPLNLLVDSFYSVAEPKLFFWLKLRLRLSKSFGSHLSFVGTCLPSFKKKKNSFFIILEKDIDLIHLLWSYVFNMNYDFMYYFSMTNNRSRNFVHWRRPKVSAPCGSDSTTMIFQICKELLQ